MSSHGLWVERYRPSTLDTYVGNETLKTKVERFIEEQNVPHLLLYGRAGGGKTTLAKIIVNAIECDYLYINASDERNIDLVRDKLKNFASSVGFKPNKIVILDEADYLNPQSTQPALRGFMEEFHKNCGFILTCNFKNRLIEPLHSRCSVIDFIIPNTEKPKLAKNFFDSVSNILNQENVKFDERAVAELLNKHFPDWRRVLNELQRYSVSGKIDAGILVNLSEEKVNELIQLFKEKELGKVRKWIVNNLDNDPVRIFRVLYDTLYDRIDSSTVPHLVLVLADYSYKSAFVADQEINLLACMIEIMQQVKFK